MARSPRAHLPVRSPSGDSESGTSGGSSLTRAGVVVALAMALGNGLNYGFHVMMSRRLGPSSYGALGALLAVTFIVAVPGLALQTVVARHTALRRRDGRDVSSLWAGVLRIVVVAGIGLALLAVATGPWVERFLHLHSMVPVLWLALTLLVLPVVLFVALGLGLNGALAGAAGGGILGCAAGLWMVWPGLAGDRLTWPLLREVLTAGIGIFALFVIVNIDIVLARHFLPRRSSGLYAVGSVVAKITYWGPRFITVVVFPRLSTSGQRRALLGRSLAAVAAVSLGMVAAVAIFSHVLLTAVFGHAYGGLGSALWLFAGIGTAFALVHLLLFAGIAAGDKRMSAAMAVAVVVKTTVVAAFLHHSVTQIAWVVFATGLCMVGVGLLLEYRREAVPAQTISAAEVAAG